MTEVTGLERLSQLQDEIIEFTWNQVADKVDVFYIQGKVSDDDRGNITSIEGNLKYMVVGDKVLKNADVVSDEEFSENAAFVRPRINELHDVLWELQGVSPVRFRWKIDTRTQKVESDWTYYKDLTDQEKEDDFWESWEGDFAWRDQLQSELDAQKQKQ